jgi:hypothetical protein
MGQGKLSKFIEYLGGTLNRIMGMNPHRGVNMIEPGCDIYGLFGGGFVNPDHQNSLHPVLAGSVHDLGQIIIVAFIVNMAMGIKKNHLYIPMVFSFPLPEKQSKCKFAAKQPRRQSLKPSLIWKKPIYGFSEGFV